MYMTTLGFVWVLGIQIQALMHVWWACCPLSHLPSYTYEVLFWGSMKSRFLTYFFSLCGLNSLQYLSISKLKSLVYWKTSQLYMNHSERMISSFIPGDCLIVWSSRIAGPAHTSWDSLGQQELTGWDFQSRVDSLRCVVSWGTYGKEGIFNFYSFSCWLVSAVLFVSHWSRTYL